MMGFDYNFLCTASLNLWVLIQVWTAGSNGWPEVNQFKMLTDLIDCISLSMIWTLTGKFCCVCLKGRVLSNELSSILNTNTETWSAFQQVSECHLFAKLKHDLCGNGGMLIIVKCR